MRIIDWSSDVCSSDLNVTGRCRILTRVRPHFFSWLDNGLAVEEQRRRGAGMRKGMWLAGTALAILAGQASVQSAWADNADAVEAERQIGRAPCRERVCQYV